MGKIAVGGYRSMPGRILRRCFPLWSYVAPAREAGAMWLPDVRTIVYSGEQTGCGASVMEFRRARCRQILTAFGFRDWCFFAGAATKPYWVSLPKDHAALLRAHAPPLLILEDDIEPVFFRPNLRPRPECQVCYLGGFRGGDSRGTRAARAAGFSPVRAWRYSYLAVDECWMRVFGMWGTHAILWLERSAMDAAAALWEASPLAIDTVLACEQWRWHCHCALTPWFFQNDGHHLRDTLDYRPVAAGGRSAR